MSATTQVKNDLGTSQAAPEAPVQKPHQPPPPPQVNLLEVAITDANTALNVMVGFLGLAQKRGVFAINESAKIFECIKIFRPTQVSRKSDFKIYDENRNLINTELWEKEEQDLARKYIQKDDIVLELGARYGSVSCIINSKLSHKKKTSGC